VKYSGNEDTDRDSGHKCTQLKPIGEFKTMKRIQVILFGLLGTLVVLTLFNIQTTRAYAGEVQRLSVKVATTQTDVKWIKDTLQKESKRDRD
jgi:hypothetical protein